MNHKEQWEKVFYTKNANEVSWTQPNPATIIDFILKTGIPQNANIIDVGGGEAFLAEKLLGLGYKNIWVPDIAESALDKAKERLKKNAALINWVVSDINEFKAEIKFDFWNDHAVFHFLTGENEIRQYVSTIKKSMRRNGYFSLGTFSETGPTTCSGLPIKQYTESAMTNVFKNIFDVIKIF